MTPALHCTMHNYGPFLKQRRLWQFCSFRRNGHFHFSINSFHFFLKAFRIALVLCIVPRVSNILKYLFLSWNEKKNIPSCFLYWDRELWHNPKSFSMHEIIPGTPGTVGCCGREIVFIFLLHQKIYNPPSHHIKTWISCYNKNSTSNMTRKKMNEEGVISVYLDQIK